MSCPFKIKYGSKKFLDHTNEFDHILSCTLVMQYVQGAEFEARVLEGGVGTWKELWLAST